jgi:hypothetical protein
MGGAQRYPSIAVREVDGFREGLNPSYALESGCRSQRGKNWSTLGDTLVVRRRVHDQDRYAGIDVGPFRRIVGPLFVLLYGGTPRLVPAFAYLRGKLF